MAVDEFKQNTGLDLHEMYMKYHPQIYSEFEEEMPKYWGKKWKANTTIGKLRTALLHKPGKEFLSVGSPTPWPPHSSDLGAWRMSWKLETLDELVAFWISMTSPTIWMRWTKRNTLEREV